MKKSIFSLVLIGFMLILLLSCANLPKSAATQPDTQISSETLTQPTEPSPSIEMGDIQKVEAGGYSLRIPEGFIANISDAQILIQYPDKPILISFFGDANDVETQSAKELANQIVSLVFEKGGGKAQLGEPVLITVNGIEGRMFEIDGNMGGIPIVGEAVVFFPTPDHFVFGLSTANLSEDKQLWVDKGKAAFEAVVQSLEFLPFKQTVSYGNCEISTDETYGYTKDNPIRVGGGWLEGPARERAFLDNLLGEDGRPIDYQRLESLTYGDTILDRYEVINAGMRTELYIDMYLFSPPQAPVEFNCISEFPLTEPEK